MNQNEIIPELIKSASRWVGYREKSLQCYDYYESKTQGAGFANWTRFGRLADIVLFGKDKRNKDGYPWCAMFLLALLYELKAGVQDCREEAGTMRIDEEARRWVSLIINGTKPLTYFAGVAAWLECARRRSKIVSDPRVGDVVIFCKDGRPFHIGLIIGVESAMITTIEGNTSSTGTTIESNGGEVARKKRKKTRNLVYCRFF